MARWKVRSCPRCGGDMFLDRDLDFWYEQCLQCSYRVELRNLEGFKEPVSSGKRHSGKHDEAKEQN
ncbi:hypothetical protein ACFLU1_02340 [Chloroflexota bacterium]